MKRFVAGVMAGLLCGAATAHAADSYLDDRSTPESLIRSLYNAINQKQYARAWGYFGDPPAKDFETYAKGFESTQHVDVLTGDYTGDGAAGSVFFNVPVAIRATDASGKISAFAGCYVLRQVNGAIQDPPYTPLHIQSAKLKPIKQDDFARYNLPKCGDAPEGGQDTAASTIESAKAKFVAEAAGECDKTADTLAGLNEPETFTIKYKHKDAPADEPENKATLYAFSCSMAAYNETNIFYLDTGAEGLKRLSFASPQFDYAYADQENAKLKSMAFKGFVASADLTNAAFDPKTNSISEFAKWRGLADASSDGTWVFDDGQFVLKDYEVDPTYDGNQNPIAIIRNGKMVWKP
ncbi:MAG: DUF1176 domain-containing protein [Alphaproteobacteria bacterium]|nr:DUF1176 domain-containing protein [Alphaproteobacteria bacterium]